MLHAHQTPAEQRRPLRERRATDDLVVLPGAFNPLSAMLIARKGFDGVYVSGAVMSADLGLPDIGLTARTDIRAIDGLDAVMDRSRALADAGAGAIFPDALDSKHEFAALGHVIDGPILANMTEFGRGEVLTNRQLSDIGINMVIYPVSLLRLAMGVAARALDTLQREGTLTSMLDEMQHRTDLYDLLDYASYNSHDESIFRFTKSGPELE